MAKIFIFRHGQTADNLEHEFSGWHQVGLNQAGIEEAKGIGEKLKNEKVTKAYQSDLIRSQETLQLVLDEFHQGFEIITDPRIKERDYGNLTMLNKDEVEKKDPVHFKLWHRSYDVPPPGGESIEMVEKRVLDFLKDNISTWKKDDVIFISAHGNSIRPMRRYFEHISIDEMCSFEHTPGKIYEYQI